MSNTLIMRFDLPWIFTVILSLMPIAINFLLVALLQTGAQWYKVLEDGKLLIFSTTLSASSIGLAFFREIVNGDLENLYICILILNLIVSNALFGIASFVKLRKEEDSINSQLFAMASIACALFAIVCSYLISEVI